MALDKDIILNLIHSIFKEGNVLTKYLLTQLGVLDLRSSLLTHPIPALFSLVNCRTFNNFNN
jgi:hypothetical protein